MIPMWLHFFDFEFVNEEHKKVRPNVQLGTTEPIEVPMKLITRNKVKV